MLAPSWPDSGAKCPWASWITCWLASNCWLLLEGSLLSSQQMDPSRSWRFMPTWSICLPLLQASWKLSMEPALLLGWTSMEAGVKALWCWAKPCWTSSWQMASACWFTGTELAWMASTCFCKSGGKAMALYHLAPWHLAPWPLGTLAGLVFLDVHNIANDIYFFPIIAMQRQWGWHNALKALDAEFTYIGNVSISKQYCVEHFQSICPFIYHGQVRAVSNGFIASKSWHMSLIQQNFLPPTAFSLCQHGFWTIFWPAGLQGLHSWSAR